MRGQRCWTLILLTVLLVGGQPAAWGFLGAGTGGVAKATVGFDLYRDYLIVVRGTAGPVKGLNFLLDTGASPSVLDSRVAAKLHLSVTPTDVAVLGGRVQGGTATVSSLGFGPMHREEIPVLVEDLSFLQRALPVQVDGMIGMDILGQGSFVIDYASREIRFGAALPRQASIPLQMKDGRAIVDATVNHATVHMLLDTGASSLILFQPVESGVGAPVSARAFGEFDQKKVWLGSFALGTAEFGHAPVFVVESPRDAGHDFDGLISPAALGMTRLAVNAAEGTMAFSREP